MTPDEQMESRKQYWRPSDSEAWDYTLCRCENNGDYCAYCESFWMDREDVLEREHPEQI